MSHTPHASQEDSTVQQFFASLDQREKISSWFLAIYIIAIFLLMIVSGVVLLS
ncbi:MAG: hypothetical protein AAB340_00230 [Patescibacteria group bacterium]